MGSISAHLSARGSAAIFGSVPSGCGFQNASPQIFVMEKIVEQAHGQPKGNS